MSDSTPPKNLPPAAHVVGGVRHAAPTGSAHVEPAKHDGAHPTPAPKADGEESGDQQILAANTASELSVRDAAEQPKAVASTYNPPQSNVHHGGNEHPHRGQINTKGQQKHIQQMGGSHGYK